METNFKQYLGDSVYADFDGYYIKLYLDNGIGKHNIIYLEPMVIDALVLYKERIDNERREHNSNNLQPS